MCRIGRMMALLALATATAAQADVAPNFVGPDGDLVPPLALGKGFFQNNLYMIPTRYCYISDQAVTDAGGPSIVSLTISTANSTEGLLQSMQVDLSGSYQSLTASAKTSLNVAESIASQHRSATAVIEASVDYPNRRIPDLELKKEFADLLLANRLDEFESHCGNRVATAEKRGIRLYSLVTIEEASAELRRQIDFSLSGGLGSGPIGAQASAAFNSELRKATAEGRVKITTFARGGDATKVISGLVASAYKASPSLDAVGAALSDFAKTMTPANAATLGFYVRDIPEIVSLGHSTFSSRRQDDLKAMWQANRTLSQRRSILEAYVAKTDPRYAEYDATGLADLAVRLQKHRTAMNDLAAAHAACLKADEAETAVCAVPTSVAPAMAVYVPPALHPPTAYWALGLRTGPGETNSQIGDWKIVDDRLIEEIQLSPAANGAGSGRPDSHLTNFITRLKSVVPDARRVQMGVALSGEDIISAELVGRLDAETGKNAGEALRTLSLRAWAGNVLKDLRFGASRDFKTLGRGYEQTDVFMTLYSKFVTPPPPCKLCQSNQQAYFDYARDYLESNFTHLDGDLAFQINTMVPIKVWINSGIKSGSGALSLKIIDRYSPTPVFFDLVRLSWKAQSQPGFYDVTIQPNSSERREEQVITAN